jgi:hypothetical protein
MWLFATVLPNSSCYTPIHFFPRHTPIPYTKLTHTYKKTNTCPTSPPSLSLCVSNNRMNLMHYLHHHVHSPHPISMFHYHYYQYCHILPLDHYHLPPSYYHCYYLICLHHHHYYHFHVRLNSFHVQ